MNFLIILTSKQLQSREAYCNVKAFNRYQAPFSTLTVIKILRLKREELIVTIKDRPKFLEIIDIFPYSLLISYRLKLIKYISTRKVLQYLKLESFIIFKEIPNGFIWT